ncbi:hypothetical protein G7046_g3092 [Stylonectria norvegica]|nr:hypothetical protein G7046_g3092 [Stylonectria norvegica]
MCDHGQDTELTKPYQFSHDFPWSLGVFDAHCHCGERPLALANLPNSRARGIAVMATRTQDQALVADMATRYGINSSEDLTKKNSKTVVAGFGRHPWFSHEVYDDTASDPTFEPPETDEGMEAAKMKHYTAILQPPPEDAAFVADLPTPIGLSVFMADTKQRLEADPHAMIGEIGLDRAFRLPMHWQEDAKANRDPERTPGGRERRPLSPHRIVMAHQQAILRAHWILAGEMQRPVSVHGVGVHGVLNDMIVTSWKGHESKSKSKSRKEARMKIDDNGTSAKETQKLPYPPRICLHSFSGKGEAVRQYLNPRFPAKIFFSFSKTNNLRDESGRSKMEQAVKMVPDDRILVETDLHTPGERMDADLEEVCRMVCDYKEWELEVGVRKLAENYREFILGER